MDRISRPHRFDHTGFLQVDLNIVLLPRASSRHEASWGDPRSDTIPPIATVLERPLRYSTLSSMPVDVDMDANDVY